jgi:hypothetical protein
MALGIMARPCLSGNVGTVILWSRGNTRGGAMLLIL